MTSRSAVESREVGFGIWKGERSVAGRATDLPYERIDIAKASGKSNPALTNPQSPIPNLAPTHQPRSRP